MIKMVKKVAEVVPEKKAKLSASDRKQRQLSRRFHKLKVVQAKDGEAKRGIIYVGHLPKGFNERELKSFFSQFGGVTKLRVSRSKKTGRSRGYAFLEFEERKTAEIAAKTMNKHLIFGRQLDVHIVEDAHTATFKHGNRDWKYTPTKEIFRSAKNAEVTEKTPEQRKARVEGLLQKEKEKRDRLKELEIDYEFGGYQALVDAMTSKKAETKQKTSKKEKEVVAPAASEPVKAKKKSKGKK